MERNHRQRNRKTAAPRWFTSHVRVPVERMLLFLLPDLPAVHWRPLPFPFRDTVPGFLDHLRRERGLQESTLSYNAAHLRRLERFLDRIGLADLGHLSPTVLSAFTVECGRDLGKSAMHVLSSDLRVFLRHLHQVGLHDPDLSDAVDGPRVDRLFIIPRSIS